MIEATVSILGTEYQIEYRDPGEDKNLGENNDGYCDFSVKLIVVVSHREEENQIEDFASYQKRCLRHEIIHAFMYESGLSNDWEHKPFGQEETVVDWIALQFPKILKVFREVGALC